MDRPILFLLYSPFLMPYDYLKHTARVLEKSTFGDNVSLKLRGE